VNAPRSGDDLPEAGDTESSNAFACAPDFAPLPPICLPVDGHGGKRDASRTQRRPRGLLRRWHRRLRKQPQS